MIARLVRGLVWVVMCFCLGTAIAGAGMAGYLAFKWQIGRDKLVQMLAVAQGIDLATMKSQNQPPREEVPPEQVSFEQVLEARAVKVRGIELQEQALRGGLDQLRFEQAKVEQQRTEFKKAQADFEQSLLAVEKQATDTGWEQNRTTLATLKPKQAKELLVQMLARKEVEDVVALLAPMPDNKRAKILGEFKTPEETKQIDEVLRLIRRGEPATAITASTQRQLGQPATLGIQGTP